jgi:hypothetical protein
VSDARRAPEQTSPTAGTAEPPFVRARASITARRLGGSAFGWPHLVRQHFPELGLKGLFQNKPIQLREDSFAFCMGKGSAIVFHTQLHERSYELWLLMSA